jgi:lysophospholipase L1-like esterase
LTRLLIVTVALIIAATAQTVTAPAAAASTTPLHIAALGDSSAAGTGAGDYEAGTEGTCWRSANSYPEQVVARLRAQGISVAFTNVACSGAATSDLYQAFLGQRSQFDALWVDTDIVLLTIGANDIGYAAYDGLCIQGDCSGAPTRAIATKLPDMARNLAKLFQDIRNRSPHAKIVLTGYGSQLTAGANADGELDPICAANVFSPQERTEGNVLSGQLDKTLRDAATQSGITFVSEYTADSFAGHSLCQADTPFYRGFDALAPGQEGPDAVLHLNKAGQTALADLVMATQPLVSSTTRNRAAPDIMCS